MITLLLFLTTASAGAASLRLPQAVATSYSLPIRGSIVVPPPGWVSTEVVCAQVSSYTYMTPESCHRSPVCFSPQHASTTCFSLSTCFSPRSLSGSASQDSISLRPPQQQTPHSPLMEPYSVWRRSPMTHWRVEAAIREELHQKQMREESNSRDAMATSTIEELHAIQDDLREGAQSIKRCLEDETYASTAADSTPPLPPTPKHVRAEAAKQHSDGVMLYVAAKMQIQKIEQQLTRREDSLAIMDYPNTNDNEIRDLNRLVTEQKHDVRQQHKLLESTKSAGSHSVPDRARSPMRWINPRSRDLPSPVPKTAAYQRSRSCHEDDAATNTPWIPAGVNPSKHVNANVRHGSGQLTISSRGIEKREKGGRLRFEAVQDERD